MECCVTVVKFDYEYLLRIKANVDVRRSIMRVAYTKMIFCLTETIPEHHPTMR